MSNGVAEPTSQEPLKRTPLAAIHERQGARMVEFGGWWMPVQYTSIIDEHHAVRNSAGLFDLSHMGEIQIHGSGAARFMQRLVTNDVTRLDASQALYTPMCLQSGGIVDDLVVYRQALDSFLLVVNASNIEKDRRWIEEQASPDVVVEDRSDETALLAIQGPRSLDVLSQLTDAPVAKLAFMEMLRDTDLRGVSVDIGRTGYTGELGYELFCAAEHAEALWSSVFEEVTANAGVPVGLGARDTLRLEARLLLYGNDLDETTTPLEAGIGWTVAWDKQDFVGAEALRHQRREGTTRRLVGFHMQDRAVARAHYPVFHATENIGEVTSGAPSPTLGKNIGLAYVASEHAKIGRAIDIEIRGSRHAARIVRTPFYSPQTANRA